MTIGLSLAGLVIWAACIALGVIAAGTLWDLLPSTQRRGLVDTLQTGTVWGYVARLRPLCFRQRLSDRPCSLAIHPVIRSLSLSCRLAALFGGALLTLFAASLIVEDQRHFVACRASGASTDACLLQISGR